MVAGFTLITEPRASSVFEGTGAPLSLDHLTGLQKAEWGLDLSLAVSAQRHVSQAHRKLPPRACECRKAKRSGGGSAGERSLI